MTRASDLAKLLTGGRTLGGTGEVIVKDIDTADGSSPKITLQTGDTDIASADVLGTINFQAPDEGTGTDAILVAAGIEAVSEGDFSSSSNATSLVFKTGASEAATEKVRVDSSGNLSIGNGTATNDGAIHVNGGSSAKNIVIESDRDSDGQGLGNLQFHSAGTNVVQVSAERGSADNSGELVLYASTSGTLNERLRIDNLKIDITSPAPSNNALYVHNTAGSSPYGIQIDNDLDINNGSNWFIHAIGNTTSRFKVFTNGNVVNTNNSYGSISDEKLKENIVDSGSQWNDIKALKVRKYSLKEDKLDAPNKLGVIAQELETAGMNGLVLDTPDVDKDLKDLGTVTKAVNYSVLYMKAVKALQEAMTRIETLEAEVTKLKG